MERGETSSECLETRFGRVGIYGSEEGVTRVVLGDRSARRRGSSKHVRKAREELELYFSGRKTVFDFALDPGSASQFTIDVWDELRRIGYGRTVSYKRLAELCGRPRAARAVAAAVARNRLPVVIPCHRVISSDGSLGGFSAGIGWKRKLLDLEAGG